MNITEFKAILDGVGCPVYNTEAYQEEPPYIVYMQTDETSINDDIVGVKVWLYTESEDSEEFKALKQALLEKGISYLFQISYDVKLKIYVYETEVALLDDICTLIKYSYVFDDIGNHVPDTEEETTVSCNVIKISHSIANYDFSVYKPREITVQIPKNAYNNQQYIKYDNVLYFINSMAIVHANIRQYKLPLMEVVAVEQVT